MTEILFDDAGWSREDVGGVPVQLLPSGKESAGVLFVLPDPDWPDASACQRLKDLAQRFQMGIVLPRIRPWWIDRPDPAFGRVRSPLAFVADELVPWATRAIREHARFAALGVGFGGQGALQLAYRFPQMFPLATAITPAIDFHRMYDSWPLLREWFETPERARQETATLRLHPLNWPPRQWFACPRGDWRFDGCERLASKLTSIGIPFEADLETPVGASYVTTQLERAIERIAKWMAEPPTNRGVQVGRS